MNENNKNGNNNLANTYIEYEEEKQKPKKNAHQTLNTKLISFPLIKTSTLLYQTPTTQKNGQGTQRKTEPPPSIPPRSFFIVKVEDKKPRS